MYHAKWTRLLGLLLCVTMVLTVLPFSVLASSFDRNTAAPDDSVVEPMAIKPPTKPDPEPDPEPVKLPSPEEKEDFLKGLKEDTVAVNLRTKEEYSDLTKVVPARTSDTSLKTGDTILIVRDCDVSKAISPTGKSVTFAASWPVTVKRAASNTSYLFSHSSSSGAYTLTFTGPITIDGNKVQSEDKAEWKTSGPLFKMSGVASLVIGSGVTLTNNRAYSSTGTANGGAIQANGGNVTIEEGAKITDCEAKTSGGAIYFEGGYRYAEHTLTISGELSGNKAHGLNGYNLSTQSFDGVGGAVAVKSVVNGTLYVSALLRVVVTGTGVVTGNEAAKNGGAIALVQGGTATTRTAAVLEKGATVTNNKAANGGAISVTPDQKNAAYAGVVEIKGDVKLSGNTATEKGNGIYCLGTGKAYADSGSVDYANVLLSGAASFEDDIYLANGSFLGVTADWTGSVNVTPETGADGTQVAKQLEKVDEENLTLPETFGDALDPAQPHNIHINGKAVSNEGKIAQQATVVINVFHNGDTKNPVEQVTLNGYAVGNTVTPDIDEYYRPAYGFANFEGWYNDGGWNNYRDGKGATPFPTWTINGWTNLYCMVTDYEPIHLVLYKNGNTDKAYNDIFVGTKLHGETVKVSDYNIDNYYSSDYGFKFDGWYNDGKWNQWLAGANPTPLEDGELTVNGWTNLKCMVRCGKGRRLFCRQRRREYRGKGLGRRSAPRHESLRVPCRKRYPCGARRLRHFQVVQQGLVRSSVRRGQDHRRLDECLLLL